MSAIAFAVCSASVVVACDGAAYDPQTVRLGAVRSKIETLAHLSAFVGVVGIGEFEILLRSFRGDHVLTYDDLIDDLPRACRAAYQCCLDNGMTDGEIEANVVAGGWSDRNQRWEGCRIATRSLKDLAAGGTGAAFEPMTLKSYLTPGPSDKAAAAVGFDPHDIGRDPVRYCVHAICAARQMSGEQDEDRPHLYAAGAFIELTTIEREAVKSQIVHRWPDRLGEPINSKAGDPIPSWFAGIEGGK